MYDMCPSKRYGPPPRKLSCHIHSEGYHCVNIRYPGSARGTTTGVHAILGDVFLIRKEGDTVVRHINDIPDDNRLENLVWGTPAENMADRARNGNYEGAKGETNWAAKLTDEDVIDIRLLRKMGAFQSELARAYGMSQQAISKVCLGYRWAHIKEGL